jgi:putative oxidoreductase
MQAIAFDRLRGWGPTILRVIVGLIFLAHGGQKLLGQGFGGVAGMTEGLGLPAPALAAVALVLVELLGGAALILGLFARLFSIPLAFSMLVATVLVHLPNGFFSSSSGVEFTLLLTVACVALALTGPGEGSLDRFLARRGIPLTGEENGAEASARETAAGGGYPRVPCRVGSREEGRIYPYSRGR